MAQCLIIKAQGSLYLLNNVSNIFVLFVWVTNWHTIDITIIRRHLLVEINMHSCVYESRPELHD